MRYANGNLILDDAETEILSMVAMKQADREYPAPEFISSIAEMKDKLRNTFWKPKPDRIPTKTIP